MNVGECYIELHAVPVNIGNIYWLSVRQYIPVYYTLRTSKKRARTHDGVLQKKRGERGTQRSCLCFSFPAFINTSSVRVPS